MSGLVFIRHYGQCIIHVSFIVGGQLTIDLKDVFDVTNREIGEERSKG